MQENQKSCISGEFMYELWLHFDKGEKSTACLKVYVPQNTFFVNAKMNNKRIGKQDWD